MAVMSPAAVDTDHVSNVAAPMVDFAVH
jgi:hypothetical protein